MDLQGERRIPASVEKTWTALNDPETLKACIAGCETLEQTGDNEYLAVLGLKIGPVNAKFKGKLQLTDIVPMTSYRINFEGQGGVAGFAKGGATVRLQDDGPATLLTYDVKAQVGGKLAQLGSRLIDGFAKKMADGFFDNFQAAVEPAPEPAEGEAEAATGKQPGWFRRMIGRK